MTSSAPLDPILKPRSIAVIGASRTPDTIGHQILVNLVTHGFTGPVYPVNPKAAAIHSIRAYPSVRDLPEAVDLAVITVPRQFVLEVAEQCGEARVGGLVVISAGFREVGEEGAAREQQLAMLVRRHGLRMVGPNCMGVINTDPLVAMNATFAPAMPPHGRVGFVSQSGALGLSVLDYASEYGIGIAQFVSMGNKPDVSGNDVLLQWEHDPAIAVVLMYVESFGNPLKFLEIASRLSRRKPIVVLKSGRSRVGARAASSHTGALAASDVAVDALLAQAGVLRASSVEELFDMAMAFGPQPFPRSRRTAVLTNSGGPGILIADALETHDLELVDLAPETVAALAPQFPAEASIRNPLDMIASATSSGYRAALTALLADPNVDSAVAIFVPPLGVRQEDVAEAIVAAARTRPEKPVLAVLMGRQGLPQGRAELNEVGIPGYIFPESAARSLAALCRYREWLERPPRAVPALEVDRATGAAIIAAARTRQSTRLTEVGALELLAAYGIPVAEARLAADVESAGAVAGELGFPVVMKIVSLDVVHKSDVGGVRVGIASVGEGRRAFVEIRERVAAAQPGAKITGVLVQRMASGGRELITGISRDPLFGALVMFGLGGIFVEALRDVTFRVAPIDARDARDMIGAIRGAPILAGIRGQPPVDRDALVDVLCRVSRLAVDFPEIEELDVNPLLGLESGTIAVDGRVRLSEPRRSGVQPAVSP